jgi:amino acid adenylation domain-containing protein
MDQRNKNMPSKEGSYSLLSKLPPEAQYTMASAVQQQFWLASHYEKTGALNCISSAVVIQGPLKTEALTEAIRRTMDALPAIGSYFFENEGTLYCAKDSTDHLMQTAYSIEPMRGKSLEDLLADAHHMSRNGFLLDRAPLIRVKLLIGAADVALLVITAHNAVWDDRTALLFGSLVSEFYNGRIPPPSSATVNAPHRPLHDSQELQQFWTTSFSEVSFSSIATEGAETADLDFSSHSIHLHFSGQVLATLEKPASRLKEGLPALLVAATGLFCGKLISQKSVSVGYSFDIRQGADSDRAGCFENVLPVPITTDFSASFFTMADAVDEKLEQIKIRAKDTSIEMIMRWLRLPRGGVTSALLNVVCSFEHGLILSLEGVRCTTRQLDPTAQQPALSVTWYREGEGLGCRLGFRSALFSSEDSRAIGQRMQTMMDHIPASPDKLVGDIELLTSHDRQFIRSVNSTQCPFDLSIGCSALLTQRMKGFPEKLACICGDRQLDYSQALKRAEEIAATLIQAGLMRQEPVGVLLERSVELPCVLIGIWIAGGAYVPLDPKFPKDRLEYMILDSGMRLIVSDRPSGALATAFAVRTLFVEDIRSAPGVAAIQPIHGTDPAYIMYTSGSTGRPKGVVIPHRAVVNFLLSMEQTPGMNGCEKLLSVTTYSFDISILELFLPLISGATLVIAQKPGDPLSLRQELKQHGITMMQATPVTWQMLLASGWEGDPQLTALCGGEPLKPVLAQSLKSNVKRLWNMYGPTETTVWSSCCEVSALEEITVGKPIANTTFHILDERLKPVVPGFCGELFIGGAGVALGYHNLAEMTAEKFLPDPFDPTPSARLYRTGDMASFHRTGEMVIRGRIDHQVKVRGFRIELGDVEAVLASYPGVDQVAATVWEEDGQNVLAGYYTVRANVERPTVGNVRRHCAQGLPEYMVPSYFIEVPSMPLTPNRKVDRKSLPRPKSADATLASPTAHLDASGLTDSLAAIWRKVLGVETIGIYDNFFEAGGNSLRAFLLIRQMGELVGRDVPLVTVFEYPTISAQAGYLSDKRIGSSPTAATRRRARQQRSFLVACGTGDVAIVGMAGRVPKAPDCQTLWRHLCEGVEAITTWERANLDPLISQDLRQNPNYLPARGIVDGIEEFDEAFFGITPKEAKFMDPQLRLFLQVAWNAFEDAGIVPGDKAFSAGVFAGMGNNFYYHYNVLSNPEQLHILGEITAEILNEKDHIAPQVSHKLNLTGPSLSVHTACSTTLVVVENAWRSLVTRQCDVALAGGVDIRTPQRSGQLFEEGGIFSQDGHCRPFDAAATGTMFGEAAAAVVMMRLDDAIEQRRPIYAVVKGAAVNHDGGEKVSYLAPSVEAQMRVIAEAQELAGINADTVSCIEAHGTATPVGDPIEFEALTRVFREQSARRGFCALGSIKANLGHTTTAAGITGIIKAALMLRHKTIVPQINYSKPNSQIDFQNSPFYITTKLQRWENHGYPRRAGISSFGFCGTNAHVVLEEAPERAPRQGPEELFARPVILVLSTRSATSLDSLTEAVATSLESGGDDPRDMAFTLACGRKRFEHRRAVAFLETGEGVEALRQKTPMRVIGRRTEQREMATAFMFPGQGSQYVNMGHALYLRDPLFRDDIDTCARILLPHMQCDIREYLYPKKGDEEKASRSLRDTFFTQPAIFMIEYALARLWIRWGIRPSALLGHSIGEFVAATLAGVFDLDQALMLVAIRASLMRNLPGGTMLSVRESAQKLEAFLPSTISIASINGPKLCVLSGPIEEVEALQKSLEAQGTICRPLHTSHAFHSAMMDPIVKPFTEVVRKVPLRKPTLPIVSTVSGQWMTPEQACDPHYWAGHLRKTVQFSSAVQLLLEKNGMVLLESGPRTTTAVLARQHFNDPARQAAVSSLGDGAEGSDEWIALHTALAELWCAGVDVDWNGYYRNAPSRWCRTPLYPFDKKRHWIEPGKRLFSTASDSEPHTAQPTLSAGDRQTAAPPLESIILRIKAILEELTGKNHATVDADASFIDIGLDSLLITQLSRALQAEFKVVLSFRKLMKESPNMTRAAQEILATSPKFESLKAAPADIGHAVGDRRYGENNIENHKNEGINAVYSASRPPVEGARLGRDKAGNPAWFIPDEKRPGKFKKVETT